MDPIEKLVAEAKARGYTPQQIQAKLKSVGIDWTPPSVAPMLQGVSPALLMAKIAGMKDKHGHGVLDGLGAALEGATLGVSKHLVPGLKEQQEDFGKDHPYIQGASNIAGALATAPLMPLKAGLAARALTGAAAGGIAAAADGEGSMAERAARMPIPAAVGAAAGVLLPGAVSKVGRGLKRATAPFRSAESQVANAVGPLLPENAVAKMARQEQLAPGASVPASLSPDIPASTRVIGANAPVAREAQKAAEARLMKIQQALDDLGTKYDQVLGVSGGGPQFGNLASGKTNIHATVVKHGMYPGSGVVELAQVHKLRSALRAKMQTTKGMPKAELAKDIKKLSEWLESHAPGIQVLDADYRELMQMKKSGEEVIKHIRQSRKAYGSSRAAGIEPGSPGASLPSKSNLFSRMFTPDRTRHAEVANELLLQPGQVPNKLLEAAARAARPRRQGLLAPFVLGSQVPSIFDSME